MAYPGVKGLHQDFVTSGRLDFLFPELYLFRPGEPQASGVHPIYPLFRSSFIPFALSLSKGPSWFDKLTMNGM
jgi:hypothetical protein